MSSPSADVTDESADGAKPGGPPMGRRLGSALVLLALFGFTVVSASSAIGAGAPNDTMAGGGVEAMVLTTASGPVADCTVSDTSVQAGESVTIDASASNNVDDYQYDKYGNTAFGDFVQQDTRTVTYSEAGTYNPRVRVWGGPQSEDSDTATCGTVTVTESTPTPTPTPTPVPSPVADCTVSDTSVQTDETVTIDASGSEHVDDYQYDKYGNTAFGDYTQRETRTVTYGEAGTYEPRVKVWGGPQSEDSDTATCGTITVTEPTPTPTPTPTPSPVADCTVSDTSVQTDESVTIDASASDNVDDYQYDKYGNTAFSDFTQRETRTVTYGEPGTYNPRVKVWGGPQSEDSDTATCGTVTVTESTPTPTPTPTPSPVADCTVSDTSVQTGETVTIDASGAENVDDYQYDKYGNSAFSDYTQQETRAVTYGEAGTYEPRVKVWGGPQSEDSDTATCGTVTVTESTPTPTPTPTSTPVDELAPSCRTPESTVSVNESVLLDARDSTGGEWYEFARDTATAFDEPTSASLTEVQYLEPGTYEPRVRVTGPDGDTEITTCGEVTVTEETAAPTATATAVPTVVTTAASTETEITVSPTETATPVPAVGETATPVPTVTETRTSSPAAGTATTSTTWFRYEPSDSETNDSVRLVAQPAVAQDAVETYGWDVDGDGTVDRRGRVLELAATTSGETTVTLLVERTNGSTASVSRAVPVSASLTTETTAPPQEVTTATGDGGPTLVAALCSLLLVVCGALASDRVRTKR